MKARIDVPDPGFLRAFPRHPKPTFSSLDIFYTQPFKITVDMNLNTALTGLFVI